MSHATLQTGIQRFAADALRPVSILYCMWLVIMGLVSFFVHLLWSDKIHAEYASILVPLQTIYYMVFGVHVFRRIKQRGVTNILLPDICYLVMFTAVHLGYVTIYTLGIVPYDKRIFYFPYAAVDALFAINLGLISFLIGFEMASKLRWRAQEFGAEGRILIPSNRWVTVGFIVVTVGVVIHFVALYLIGSDNIVRYGYTVIQDTDRFHIAGIASKLVAWSVQLIGLGVIIYGASSALRHGRLFSSKIGMMVVLGTIGIFILEGDRGPMLYTVLPLALIQHFFIRPIKIRYLAMGAAGVLVLFPALSAVRSHALRPAQMLEQYRALSAEEVPPWYAAFYELGGSFVTLNITVHEVPEQEPYWRGRSWREAAAGAIPFLQGFAQRQGWLGQPPSRWVTLTYWGPGRAGRAFTVVAEGHLNFGAAGIIIQMAAMGLVLRWLMIFFVVRPSAMRALVFLGGFGYSIIMIRNHLGVGLGHGVQLFVLAWLLQIFLGNQSESEYGVQDYAQHVDMPY